MNNKKTKNTGNLERAHTARSVIKDAATGATARDIEFEAEVLFQRIYDKWYAFSVVEDDCLVTEVSEDEVQKRLNPKKLPRAS